MRLLRLWWVLSSLLVVGLAGVSAGAQAAAGKLTVTFIDVEGGQATLFVTPAGKSLLIDTGWSGHEGRDADRIVAAAHGLGLKKIDAVLITHFHADHVGGVPQLVERIPVGMFFDHGPSREMDTENAKALYAAYEKVLADGHYGHVTPKPGDLLPIEGMEVRVISADGAVIEKPLEGAGQPNGFCAARAETADATENARSLGVEITFGRLKILDLGDLTKDKEQQLMCPVNRVGGVDVLVVSHHGWDQSSSAALVDAVAPRVAIMDNGATKGGSTVVLDTVQHSPGLETLWELHFSEEGGTAHNTGEAYIANLKGPDAAYSLVLTADRAGAFEVKNTRTGTVKSYAARR